MKAEIEVIFCLTTVMTTVNSKDSLPQAEVEGTGDCFLISVHKHMCLVTHNCACKCTHTPSPTRYLFSLIRIKRV